MHQNKIVFEALDKKFEKYKLKSKGDSKFLTEDNKHFRMLYEPKGELSVNNSLWVTEVDVEYVSDNFDVYNYEAADLISVWFSKKFNVVVDNVGQLIHEYTKPLSINVIDYEEQ